MILVWEAIGAIVAGYTLALIVNLGLMFLFGRMGSKLLTHSGEVKMGFYTVTALVWLATAAAGASLSTYLAPSSPAFFGGTIAIILTLFILKNERELMMRQPARTTLLSVCSVAAGTTLGIFGTTSL